MPKVVSVDAALRENMPYVEFRERFYQLRDFTIREQVEMVLDFKEKQEAAEAEREAAMKAVKEAEADDEDADDVGLEELRERSEESVRGVHEVYGEAFSRALVDFPAEMVEDMTEREIKALADAIQKAQEITFPVSVRTQDEMDPKLVGRAAR